MNQQGMNESIYTQVGLHELLDSLETPWAQGPCLMNSPLSETLCNDPCRVPLMSTGLDSEWPWGSGKSVLTGDICPMQRITFQICGPLRMVGFQMMGRGFSDPSLPFSWLLWDFWLQITFHGDGVLPLVLVLWSKLLLKVWSIYKHHHYLGAY